MARRKQPVIPDPLLDQLLAGADAKAAFEKDGLLDELKKALAERVLNAEMDYHLGAGEGDGRANSRNGYGQKTVLTDTGKIPLDYQPHEVVIGTMRGSGRCKRRTCHSEMPPCRLPCRSVMTGALPNCAGWRDANVTDGGVPDWLLWR